MWQFALIAERLRGELVGVAEACGVGSMAEDVAAEVIAGWCRRVAGDPPVTFATADAFERLRAGLLVSVRNAAMNWQRDNSRTVAVDDAALAELVGPDPHDMDAELFDGVDVAALSEALSRLDPVQAEVARLVGLEGLSVRQAGVRLGVSKSTAAEAWVKVQAVLRGSVRRYLTGGYCREVAPHLALLDAQRRATRAGLPDRPLDDALGAVEAGRVARHVYGDPAGGGGCAACRRTRTRERAALGVFLPPPLLTPPPGFLTGFATRSRGRGTMRSERSAVSPRRRGRP